MKKILLFALSPIVVLSACTTTVKETSDKPYEMTFSWDCSSAKEYQHFKDLGNYTLLLNDVDIPCDDSLLAHIGVYYHGPQCTATAKLNSKGEVIIGRNMDVDVSQTPCFIQHLNGAKHDVVCFTYGGNLGKYRYDQVDEMDKDTVFLSQLVSSSVDAMNETGLYIEADLREMDPEYHVDCEGVFPDKPVKATFGSLANLVALNCSTVDEALDYIRNSYNWYGVYSDLMGTPYLINLCFIIGDATGNFGLVEFCDNQMRYFPYCPGQGNYYMHPDFAEFSQFGSGYGRLSAALKGLEACETEGDMMKNMENCIYSTETLNPGTMGYSDLETNLCIRRATPKDELQTKFEALVAPVQPLIKEYKAGNETPLRENGTVWTTSFHVGVNCHTKHLMLMLWERPNCVMDLQWK